MVRRDFERMSLSDATEFCEAWTNRIVDKFNKDLENLYLSTGAEVTFGFGYTHGGKKKIKITDIKLPVYSEPADDEKVAAAMEELQVEKDLTVSK